MFLYHTYKKKTCATHGHFFDTYIKAFQAQCGKHCFIKDCQLLPHQIGYNNQQPLKTFHLKICIDRNHCELQSWTRTARTDLRICAEIYFYIPNTSTPLKTPKILTWPGCCRKSQHQSKSKCPIFQDG